jgi:hypothetical protein
MVIHRKRYNHSMAFENSPRLDKPSVTQVSFWGRVYQFRRIILVLAVIVVLISSAALAILLVPAIYATPPGGLEGCLINTSGAPLVTTVRSGTISAATDANGCFFFPSLPAGGQQLIVTTPAREVNLPVTIVSNEATSLGTITINP